jgi:eukaryotic-like serine/threonine-protein kinase
MTLKLGDILNNRYQIVKQLGQGGFGAVYRAEDLSLKTPCAIKENLDYWDEAQRQFELEALMLANLRHPNLPRVTDYFVILAQGQYLVMDFVEGNDLQQVIDRAGLPPLDKKVLNWIDQICDALAYLHSQAPPIIHRDVKPANIRVTPAGKAMLVDFGVAKLYSPTSKTTMGARAVTAGYSPVEQYGQGTTDTRADIYALGATLYALLTGQRPPESIDRVTGTPLPPPRQLNPHITVQLEQVILRAMEVLAPSRFATISDFRQALRAAAAVREPTQPRSSVPGAVPGGVVSTPISRPITTRAIPPSHKTAVQVEWVTIPSGEFQFGEERRKLFLPAYQIARFPITNQQYRLFLKANPQYLAPDHWKGRDFPLGKARHPVVGVSLQDALAFCRWLGYRLPSAEEWEKAARGTDGRSYPWGENWLDGKYCNNFEARVEGTTPVDRYPDGRSPYDVWDMVGNVWEWTASEHQSPLMREVRGGSWRTFSKFALRVMQYEGLLVDDRRDDLGFRCVQAF